MRLATSSRFLSLGHEFRLLWIAQSTSAIGTQISQVALPLFAVSYLGLSPLGVGILLAMEGIPPVALGLFAGILVDRADRRAILLWGDLLRFVVMALVPILYGLGGLTAPTLYLCALAVQSITIFFDIAYRSYLPEILTTEQLTLGNSLLMMAETIAGTTGSSVAGALTSLIGAPLALILDAASYFVSFCCMRQIPRREIAGAEEEHEPILQALAAGIRFVLGSRTIITLALGAALWHLVFFSTLTNLYIYLARVIEMPAYFIGILLGCSGLGAILTSSWVPVLRERCGPMTTLAGALILAQAALLLIPLVKHNDLASVGALGLILFAMGAASQIHIILHMTLRQEVTPAPLLGRMTSVVRLVSWGAMPLGSLLGGLLAEEMSSAQAFLITSVGGLALTAAWCLLVLGCEINPTPALKASEEA